MQTIIVWEFPAPSSAIAEGGVRLVYPGADATLLFDYYDEKKDDIYNSGIVLKMTQAHRHRSEMFTRDLINAYDYLVEVIDSEWVAELRAINPRVADYWKIKHYAIFLKSYGLFEFIASDFQVLDTKKGGLI